MPDKIYLRQMQALPLRAKVLKSQLRTREWYEHFNGNVYISFSGGKDSTVLAHVVHELYPDVPLVFCNTGLEYPEIQEFARKMGAEFIRPKMSFSEVISTYGYPIISKENAEAIHYARKIRIGGGTTTQRRNEPNSTARDCTSTDAAQRTEITRWGYNDSPSQTGTHGSQSPYEGRTGWRRATLTGKPLTCKEISHVGGHQTGQRNVPQESGHYINEGKVRQQNRGSTDWRAWRRRTIAGVGEFSKENKSIFNKEKWLPLCRDTQFKISHQCCSVMKKSPMGIYQRKHKSVPFIGTLAEESRLREQAWVRHGCNAFDAHKQTSQPLSFWTEQDILKYLYVEGWEIASVYGDIVGVDDLGFEYQPLPGVDCKLKCTGCQRTGCVFCGFGCHLEKGETRFQRLAKTHPKQYEYCMNGGQWVDNPDYDPTAPKMDGDWENWNPKKIWVPSKEGLGMKKVFDDCNQIYGKDFIRYE